MKKVLVVGGGAAGLMAAISAADFGANVTVVEKNQRPARKLMITGKGRCNVTNNTDLNGLIKAVTKNGKFLYSAFSEFSSQDTMTFFEENGVALKTERGNRVFPLSDKAVDIVDALVGAAKKRKITFVNATAAELVFSGDKVGGIKTTQGEVLFADSVIIATGGVSYPLTGSTGDGYILAKQAEHTVTDLTPSLIPLECLEGFCSELQGLSLKNVKVTLQSNNKTLFSELGEMLFTHYGVSGPLILSASAYVSNLNDKAHKIIIDLKPALDTEKLGNRIQRDFAEMGKKDFINALGQLLPNKMVPVIVKLSKIPPNTKVNQITKQQRDTLTNLLKNLTLTVTAFRPIEEAIVTKGGVAVSGINPKTMQSKLKSGLYFAGEVLDVDAFTGGFNLQIAFSTGYAAGKYAALDN